jgi:signal transduction histidine kinase
VSGQAVRWTVRGFGATLLVLLVAALWLTAMDPTIADNNAGDDVFIWIIAIGLTSFAAIGLLLASRVPGNPIGWLYAAGGIGLIFSLVANDYAVRGSTDLSLPAVGVVAAISNVVGFLAIFALILALLLFPNGTVVSRRWRLVVWAIVVGAVSTVLAVVGTPSFTVGATMTVVANPFHVSALAPFERLGTVATFGGIVGALGAFASIVVRYVRARGVERQQIRWLAFAVGVVIVAALVVLIAGIGGSQVFGDAAYFVLLTALLIAFPAATAVAILRYRLFELDLVIRKAAVFVIVALAITAVLLLIGVALGGSLTGGDPATAAIGAFVLGLFVVPTWRVASRIADRLVFGGRTSPYEALTVLSGSLSEAYATDDILPRIASLVGEVTRATRTRVWIAIGPALHPKACWPGEQPDPAPMPTAGDALPTLPDAEHAAEIRDRGELLGALTASFPANDPLDPTRRALIDDLARQAGPVLRNMRLIEELRASRRRIVSAQDARAKKLERDIHDGAQQQLVALAVKLRLAAQAAERDPKKTRQLLSGLQGDANDALETLRDLARGIYPPLLADQGLAAALEAQARKSSVPTTVHADGTGRYAPETEAGVYFCSLEAITNATKYAEASTISITLVQSDGHLRFTIADDGRGFDPIATPRGTGLQGMTDRIEAIGGRLELSSSAGGGTTVRGLVPIGAPADRRN